MTSSASSTRNDHRAAKYVLVLGLGVLVAVALSARSPDLRIATSPDVPDPAYAVAPDGDPAASPESSSSTSDRHVARPTGIRIPAIDVAADAIPLGIRDDGTIEVPEHFDQTGWWADGPEPGEPGPAVILGHVDSTRGPAVFHRLGELVAGDLIHVDREDGTTVSFRVDRIEQHPKNDFPTDAVYGRTGEASVLRLVTCGGDFDRSARSYLDNMIVFATLLQ